ncbi:MAG TPA: hypothetical protein VGZ00_01530, partial [Candidatus Baltobacteraceae bacterium]|nr:hypothetical protein [Candidatus Baltobacteraceae bacterium]
MIEAQGEGQPSGLCEKQRKPQDWFKPRGYQHLDTPVGIRFANKATQPDFVARHSFTPLIHYVKRTKRYKPENGKTEFKNRSIMYASHRDACILSCYANKLNHALNAYYTANDLSDCVIAYRKLEKANYDFAADVQVFAREKSPCVILCFDVTDFFGSLDHRLLKQRLKEILSVSTLSSDWYQIFRTVAKYRYINKEDLQKHPVFGERMKGRSLQAIG